VAFLGLAIAMNQARWIEPVHAAGREPLEPAVEAAGSAHSPARPYQSLIRAMAGMPRRERCRSDDSLNASKPSRSGRLAHESG